MTAENTENVHNTKTQDLILRYIKWSDKTWIQVLSPFAFILLFTISFKSMEVGVAMAISMVIHELAHAYVFAKNGVSWRILWLFPLGAVASPDGHEENEKSDQLPWWRLSWLMLAGPAINVVLMALGANMVYFEISPSLGEALITVNGYLLALNLIPLGALDAGQHFKLIFSSLKRKHEMYLVVGVFLLFCALWGGLLYWGSSVLLVIILNIGWFGGGVIILISIFLTSLKDDETLADSPLAMTRNQAIIATALYLVLVFLTLLLWTGLPVLS